MNFSSAQDEETSVLSTTMAPTIDNDDFEQIHPPWVLNWAVQLSNPMLLTETLGSCTYVYKRPRIIFRSRVHHVLYGRLRDANRWPKTIVLVWPTNSDLCSEKRTAGWRMKEKKLHLHPVDFRHETNKGRNVSTTVFTGARSAFNNNINNNSHNNNTSTAINLYRARM